MRVKRLKYGFHQHAQLICSHRRRKHGIQVVFLIKSRRIGEKQLRDIRLSKLLIAPATKKRGMIGRDIFCMVAKKR